MPKQIETAEHVAESIEAGLNMYKNLSTDDSSKNYLDYAGDTAALVNFLSSWNSNSAVKAIVLTHTAPITLGASIQKIYNGTAIPDTYTDILALIGIKASGKVVGRLAVAFSGGYKVGDVINTVWSEKIDAHFGAYANEVGDFYSELSGSTEFGATMAAITRALGSVEFAFEKGLDIVGVTSAVDDIVRWSTESYVPDAAQGPTLEKLLNYEKDLQKHYKTGFLNSDFYSNFSKWSSDTLRNNFNNFLNPSAPTGSSGFNFGLDTSGLRYTPIGAFYDSRSLATDSATSIADKTYVLFDQNQKGVSAEQLSALDSNRDGQLSGAELNNLSAWADLNENGQVDTDEMKSLAQRGITRIRSTDFQSVTQGNSRLAGAVVAEAGLLAVDRSTPLSNYRQLRDKDPLFESWNGVIYWHPNQVKIHFKQQNVQIGTDGDDAFDAGYYAAYTQFFNTNLLTHFLGGGGNYRVGGIVCNDLPQITRRRVWQKSKFFGESRVFAVEPLQTSEGLH